MRPDTPERTAVRALELSAEGYCCAEAVLMAVAEFRGIESPLIPAMATGFCTGVAGSAGLCGALAGGILAVNIVLGRNRPDASRDENYAAVKTLIGQFEAAHGATGCSALLGCNPGTSAGRIVFQLKGLKRQCARYAATVAECAARLTDRA
jgi:C_GCAxxG_C_C family probable redox protein